MADALIRRLVPDELWELVEPLLPKAPKRPQGGGRARAESRRVFAAVALVLSGQTSWRSVPPAFGVAVPTAHRWFARWTVAGVWDRLALAAESREIEPELAEWLHVLVESAVRRAGATDQRSLSAMAAGAPAEVPVRRQAAVSRGDVQMRRREPGPVRVAV
ncbi:transposase [Amycolatopsis sp. 195334CR]|uniref:transposase n=1 Tax=Amycolatopsis sp. 195334CR TaxID=2814588 RepID=UPI001A906823|nr:transposase [Amycolatopsis sp. 195334CR]